MFRCVNLVPEGSEIKGWKVSSTPRKKNPKMMDHHVSLDGADRSPRLGLERQDYENLTVPYGTLIALSPGAFTKLQSVCIGKDKYLPVITSAPNMEENQNIILFNLETDPGDVLISIELENATSISYFITNQNKRSRITVIAMDDNHDLPVIIKVQYGMNGGHKALERRITLSAATDPKISMNEDKEYVECEKIAPGVTIGLPRVDLSKLCVNEVIAQKPDPNLQIGSPKVNSSGLNTVQRAKYHKGTKVR